MRTASTPSDCGIAPDHAYDWHHSSSPWLRESRWRRSPIGWFISRREALSPVARWATNILEVQGSLVAFAMALESLPAVILLDFDQAFASLARRWMWMVLDCLGVCVEHTTVYHQGCYLTTSAMAAGIKQGCPLSGSLFALAAGGLIRASMTVAFLRSARICLFADDFAFVVYHIGIALNSLLALMGRWRLATGLALKVSKCAVVMGKPAQELEYRDLLESHSDVAGMQLVDAALYLGVFGGPGAPERQ